MFIEAYFPIRSEIALGIELLVLGIFIYFFGTRFLRHFEFAEDRLKKSNTWWGMALLAIAFALPESIIALVASSQEHSSIGLNLATGTLLGANAFTLILIIFFNFFYGNEPSRFYTQRAFVFANAYNLLLIGLVGVAFFSALSFGNRSFFQEVPGLAKSFSYGIPFFFLVGTYSTFRYVLQEQAFPKFPETHLPKAMVNNASLICSGTALVLSCFCLEKIAVFLASRIWFYQGLEFRFGEILVGTFFLGFFVTLPKIGLVLGSLASRRSDLLLLFLSGSFLWNCVMLVICDLFQKPSLFAVVGQQHFLSVLILGLFLAVVLTSVITPKKRSLFRLACELLLLIVLWGYWAYALGHISMQIV